MLLLALAALVATGCMRLDVGVIVHDESDSTISMRMTFAPEVLALVGGDESLVELREEILEQGIIPMLDDTGIPSLGDSGGGAVGADSLTAELVRDDDGWRGVFASQHVPTRDLIARDQGRMQIGRTENGWLLTWELPDDLAGPAEPLLGDIDQDDVFDVFEFTYSATLPGHLEHSDSPDVVTRDGMTTARWEIDLLDPAPSQGFILATTDESGALGPGTIAGIITAGAAAIALVWLWWSRQNRRRSKAGAGEDADTDRSSDSGSPEAGFETPPNPSTVEDDASSP